MVAFLKLKFEREFSKHLCPADLKALGVSTNIQRVYVIGG